MNFICSLAQHDITLRPAQFNLSFLNFFVCLFYFQNSTYGPEVLISIEIYFFIAHFVDDHFNKSLHMIYNRYRYLFFKLNLVKDSF